LILIWDNGGEYSDKTIIFFDIGDEPVQDVLTMLSVYDYCGTTSHALAVAPELTWYSGEKVNFDEYLATMMRFRVVEEKCLHPCVEEKEWRQGLNDAKNERRLLCCPNRDTYVAIRRVFADGNPSLLRRAIARNLWCLPTDDALVMNYLRKRTIIDYLPDPEGRNTPPRSGR